MKGWIQQKSRACHHHALLWRQFFDVLEAILTRVVHCRLKSKGLNISSTGVSVKTSHRYTREDQIDATQRCVCLSTSFSFVFCWSLTSHIIRAMGAASFRKGEAPQVPDEQMPQMQRQWSMKSETSTKSSNAEEKEKKKKKLFGSSRWICVLEAYVIGYVIRYGLSMKGSGTERYTVVLVRHCTPRCHHASFLRLVCHSCNMTASMDLFIWTF